jgi:hypothetical protein
MERRAVLSDYKHCEDKVGVVAFGHRNLFFMLQGHYIWIDLWSKMTSHLNLLAADITLVTHAQIRHLDVNARQKFHPIGRGNGSVLRLQYSMISVSRDWEPQQEIISITGDVAFLSISQPYAMAIE